VVLASGKTAPIGKLRPGQKVLSTSTTSGKTRPAAVAAVLVHHDTDLYDLRVATAHGTAVIDTTRSHLFWDAGHHRWVKAAALRYGTRLRTPAGGTATVTGGHDPKNTTGWMSDLTIPGNHDFYVQASASATAILVHNCPMPNARGSADGAAALQARAAELQGSRGGWMGSNGTTAVIKLINTSTGEMGKFVATEAPAMPEEFKGLLQPDEQFVPGIGHAEQTIMDFLGEGWDVVEGGASRNVCEAICAPRIFRAMGDLGGPRFPGAQDKTPYRMFWQR
jgi:hypothetical protein